MTRREEFDAYIRHFYDIPETAELDDRHRSVAFERAVYDMRTLADYLLHIKCTPYLFREFLERHWRYRETDETAAKLASLAVKAAPEAARSGLERYGYLPLADIKRICESLRCGYESG